MSKEQMITFIVASGLVDIDFIEELKRENKSYIQGLFFGALMHQSRKEVQ